MSNDDAGTRPPASPGSGPGPGGESSPGSGPGLDDAALAGRLRELLSGSAPPAWSADLLKASYGLRDPDAELASLSSDTGVASSASGLRTTAAPRLAVFGTASLSVEVELEPGGQPGTWRLVGQLVPPGPATIELRQPGAALARVTADGRGRFAATGLGRGPLSLVCQRDGERATATQWITVG